MNLVHHSTSNANWRYQDNEREEDGVLSGFSRVVCTERNFVPRQSNFNFVLQRQSNFVSLVVPVCPLVIVPASYIAKLSPSLPSLCITCICDNNVAAEYIPAKMMISSPTVIQIRSIVHCGLVWCWPIPLETFDHEEVEDDDYYDDGDDGEVKKTMMTTMMIMTMMKTTAMKMTSVVWCWPIAAELG